MTHDQGSYTDGVTQSVAPSYELTQLPNGWTVGKFSALSELGIPHLVTTRAALDAALVGSDPAAAAVELARAMELEGVTYARQMHESRVLAVGGPGLAGEADGLATDRPGLGLMALSADCPLVLLADRLGGAVGIAHASWRATVKRVAGHLVHLLASRFGAKPSNLAACIGPSAGPCCYEVGLDVYQKATVGLGRAVEKCFVNRQGRMYLDLWAANREQLIREGLNPADVHVAGVCTICHHDQYPSFRVEGESAGRFAAVIALPGRAKE